MDNREKLIEFLISEYDNENSNKIRISKDDIEKLNIPENIAVKILLSLQEDDLIVAKPESLHKNFSACWNIVLKQKCLNYFLDKKQMRIADRREFIRTYVPIIISSIALAVSICSLLLSLHNLF